MDVCRVPGAAAGGRGRAAGAEATATPGAAGGAYDDQDARRLRLELQPDGEPAAGAAAGQWGLHPAQAQRADLRSEWGGEDPSRASPGPRGVSAGIRRAVHEHAQAAAAPARWPG